MSILSTRHLACRLADGVYTVSSDPEGLRSRPDNLVPALKQALFLLLSIL